MTKIAMWSGPRSISTALMRSFGNRPDTFVSDEPFYAHYLYETEEGHPYGTDIILETQGALKGKTYNPIRGKKVIEYSRTILDKYIPLKNSSWKDLEKVPEVLNNKLNLKLKYPNQLVGYNKK